MAQHYSDPSRADLPHSLPDLETFFVDSSQVVELGLELDEDDDPMDWVGWYWQPCFPGCLPDAEPMGPFATEEEALEDARGYVVGE